MRCRDANIDLRLVVVCDNNNSNNDGNDDEDDNADEQAPPLLAVAATCADNCSANLLVAFCDVLADCFTLHLDVGNEWLLLLHDLIEVLEELGELDHLALDVLNGFVALLDIAEGRAGLAAAVGAEELEYCKQTSDQITEREIRTACWKMGASGSATASLTSASVASGRTMRYWRSAAC